MGAAKPVPVPIETRQVEPSCRLDEVGDAVAGEVAQTHALPDAIERAARGIGLRNDAGLDLRHCSWVA